MYKAKKIPNVMNAFSFSKYQTQILSLTGFIILSSLSASSHALATNPGAVCSSDFSQSSLTNADYSSLASAGNNYVTVAGNAVGSIPLQIRMTTSETNGPPTNGSFNAATIGSNSAFNIIRDWPSVNSVTSVNLDFRNSITEQPIFLTNVALSAFDIDYANNANNSFDDYVLFTGVTASGSTIDGAFQSVQASGSNIRAFRDARPNTTGIGLYTVNTNTSTECPGINLDTACQGSVQFSEPVSSVKIRYSNANYRTSYNNSTNQQIFFRLDNYCYVPQYIFSGTVFDDNGGIPASSANKDNADITSSSSVYTNKPKFFNGIYDPTAPEAGIAGSTVRLANCSSTSTTYPTQSVIREKAPIGEYQISIPKTTLANNTNLCLVESRTGSTYPIRTSNESRNVGFSATKYNYPNNDFGRVIAENAALVLRKSQYVNNCPSTINYTATALNTTDNSDPTKGFSESSINGNLIPGQCIAYRITATNRSNLSINDFTMQDKLQEKGKENAVVSSFLTLPISTTNDSDYAANSVKIGDNGIVRTKPLVLPARSKRDFYFNTRYGTITNSQ
ncbi:hypothetical protein ACT3QR_01380 [Psychrobacter sp. AOP7-B1-25]|uniref:hypothetical protein n=1 Tax=Psychrobacter sp. AOP7-B1-25 TaxID=3457644 RepID=UPI00402B41C5